MPSGVRPKPISGVRLGREAAAGLHRDHRLVAEARSSVSTNTVRGRPDGLMPALARASSIVPNAPLRLSKPSSQLLVPARTAAALAGRVTSATSSGSAGAGTSDGRPRDDGALPAAPAEPGAGAAPGAGSCDSVTPPPRLSGKAGFACDGSPGAVSGAVSTGAGRGTPEPPADARPDPSTRARPMRKVARQIMGPIAI